VKTRWQEYSRKYAALTRREKILVAAAVLALIGYFGSLVWVTPPYRRAASFSQRTLQQVKEIAGLQAQIEALRQQVATDPNAALQASLAVARDELKAADQRLAAYESSLIRPAQMGEVLDSLLGRSRSVRLVSLKTLTAEPLLAPRVAPAGPAGEQTPPVLPSVNMYKHGFVLKLEGDYLDLLAYLGELERQPRQLLWQRATLTVPDGQKPALTLTFFTLSFDKVWIAL